MLPLLLGASALAMTVGAHAAGGRGVVGVLAVGGSGSLVIAATAALGWPLVVTAAVAVTVAAVTVLVTGPRWLPALPAMATAAGFLLAADAAPLAEVPIALALMVIAVELACRTRAERPAADVEITFSAFAGAALVATCVPQHWVAALLGAFAVAIAVVAGRSPLTGARSAPARDVRRRRRHDRHPDRHVGRGGHPGARRQRGDHVVEDAGAVDRSPRRRADDRRCAVRADGDRRDAGGGGGGHAHRRPVVLTGTSFVVLTSGPVASAAMTASAVAAVFAPAGAPVLVSVAIVLFGIQVALEGVVRSLPQVARAGAGVAAVGTISVVVDERRQRRRARAGSSRTASRAETSPSSTVSVLLLAAGAYAGRVRTDLSTWVTVAPGLGTLTVWLVDAQLTRSVGWSVPLALGLGVVAVGIGGWRRLAAPLVIGTATIGITIVVSAGPRLAELDSWMWLALGGLGLIAVAVLVERTVSADRAPIDWRGLRNTWR